MESSLMNALGMAGFESEKSGNHCTVVKTGAQGFLLLYILGSDMNG